MKPSRWAVGLVLGLMPGCAIPQGVPGGLYSVINNTRQAQTCAIRSDISKWSGWFRIDSRKSMSRSGSGAKQLYIQCRPPVRQVRYTLKPGVRYSLLPQAGGGVDLVEVTLGEPR